LRSVLLLIIPASVLVLTGLYLFALTQPDEYRAAYLSQIALWPIVIAAEVRRAWLMGEGRFGLATLERGILAITRGGFIVFLFVSSSLTVVSAAIATLASGLLGGITLLFGRTEKSERIPPAPIQHGSPVRYSLTSWVAGLAVATNARVDQLVMAPLVPLSQLGLYAAAVTLATIPAMVTTALQSLMFTRGARSYGAESLIRVTSLATWCNAVLVLVTVVTAPVTVPLLFGEDFAPAVHLVAILGLAQLFAGPTQIIEGVLLSQGRPGDQAAAQYAGLAVTAFGLLLLVPAIGVAGAASASVCAYLASYVVASSRLARTLGCRRRDLALTLSGIRARSSRA